MLETLEHVQTTLAWTEVAVLQAPMLVDLRVHVLLRFKALYVEI